MSIDGHDIAAGVEAAPLLEHLRKCRNRRQRHRMRTARSSRSDRRGEMGEDSPPGRVGGGESPIQFVGEYLTIWLICNKDFGTCKHFFSSPRFGRSSLIARAAETIGQLNRQERAESSASMEIPGDFQSQRISANWRIDRTTGPAFGSLRLKTVRYRD